VAIDSTADAAKRAVSDMRRARNAGSWDDETRRKLDKERLEPIGEAGKALVAALERATAEFSSVRHVLK
jgi:hypothetical protein